MAKLKRLPPASHQSKLWSPPPSTSTLLSSTLQQPLRPPSLPPSLPAHPSQPRVLEHVVDGNAASAKRSRSHAAIHPPQATPKSSQDRQDGLRSKDGHHRHHWLRASAIAMGLAICLPALLYLALYTALRGGCTEELTGRCTGLLQSILTLILVALPVDPADGCSRACCFGSLPSALVTCLTLTAKCMRLASRAAAQRCRAAWPLGRAAAAMMCCGASELLDNCGPATRHKCAPRTLGRCKIEYVEDGLLVCTHRSHTAPPHGRVVLVLAHAPRVMGAQIHTQAQVVCARDASLTPCTRVLACVCASRPAGTRESAELSRMQAAAVPWALCASALN